MPGIVKRRKSGSEEERNGPTIFIFSDLPHFLTSDLPHFAGSKPDDERKASRK